MDTYTVDWQYGSEKSRYAVIGSDVYHTNPEDAPADYVVVVADPDMDGVRTLEKAGVFGTMFNDEVCLAVEKYKRYGSGPEHLQGLHRMFQTLHGVPHLSFYDFLRVSEDICNASR